LLGKHLKKKTVGAHGGAIEAPLFPLMEFLILLANSKSLAGGQKCCVFLPCHLTQPKKQSSASLFSY